MLAMAIATPAFSAQWDVRISGYGEYILAFSSSDVSNDPGVDFDGVDTKQDVEIHFRPSIKLDNGWSFGANVQLEGNTTGDSIDESYLFAKGPFGEFNLGSENSAGYKLSLDAPSVLFFGPDDMGDFHPIDGSSTNVNTGDDFSRGPFAETAIENDRNNDADRITYYTPEFAGLTVGVSYARDGDQDNNTQQDISDVSGELHDIFDIGAKYERDFGGVSIAVSGRWGIATRESGVAGGPSTEPQVWAAGAEIGFNGLTIGGSFAEQNDSGTEDGTGYRVGIAYKTGPWGVSFTYHHGENVDDEQPVAGADEEIDIFMLGASYALAKGVKLNAFGTYVDFKEDFGDAGGAGDDVDGFAVGTGVKISF